MRFRIYAFTVSVHKKVCVYYRLRLQSSSCGRGLWLELINEDVRDIIAFGAFVFSLSAVVATNISFCSHFKLAE